MRTLVTGGGGFIGSHVVDRLVAAGHDVHVVDLRPPHRPDVGHFPADINDLDALVTAFAGADVVFHLAAYADVNDVSREPVDATDANVVGAAKVWEACRRNHVKRAVLASTVWVYNGAADDGDGPLDEDAAFRLDDLGHLYTSSKVAAEMVAHSYRTLYGQEFTILRYGIPYGPRMRDALGHPQVRRDGPAWRAADHPGRREPVPQLRLRGGPRRGARPRPAPRGGEPDLQPRGPGEDLHPGHGGVDRCGARPAGRRDLHPGPDR